MQIDPVSEWQRLTEFYREKGDEELKELAEDFGNLTETAQQVLTTELRSRGLSMPSRNPQQASFQVQAPRDTRFAGYVDPDVFRSRDEEGNDGEMDSSDPGSDEDFPNEFTWKTILCEAGDSTETLQLREALYRAGIESWVDNRASRVGLSGPKILVAADQLEAAQAIAAQPIPQEVIDYVREAAPEYVPPTCPECHAEDPVLESADPSNNWLCEACGARWSDPVPDSGTDPARSTK
jgi:hypothetical protein